MITSQRAELPSKIKAYYGTWTRLGLSAAPRQLRRIIRDSRCQSGISFEKKWTDGRRERAESGIQCAIAGFDAMSDGGRELRASFHDVFVQVQPPEHKAPDRVEGI
jgi:hypothetical protein